MYPVVPADSVAFAWQGLAYLLTTVSVFFGWFMVPR